MHTVNTLCQNNSIECHGVYGPLTLKYVILIAHMSGKGDDILML